MHSFVLSRHESPCEVLQTQRLTFRYCFQCFQNLDHSRLTSIARSWIWYKDETKCRTEAHTELLCQNKLKMWSLLRFHSQLPSMYWRKICLFSSTQNNLKYSQMKLNKPSQTLLPFYKYYMLIAAVANVWMPQKLLEQSTSQWETFTANVLWLKQYVTFGVKPLNTKVCLLIKLCISLSRKLEKQTRRRFAVITSKWMRWWIKNNAASWTETT